MKKNLTILFLSIINLGFFLGTFYAFITFELKGMQIIMPYLVFAINIIFAISTIILSFLSIRKKWISLLVTLPSFVMLGALIYFFEPVLYMTF